MVVGERNIRKKVEAPIPGSDAEFLPGNAARKTSSVSNAPQRSGQLTFEAFEKPASAVERSAPRLSVQQELISRAGAPPTNQAFIRDHHVELKTLQDTIRDRVNRYAVGPGDPDLVRLNVFNELKRHHEDSRTTQANYADLICRAKEHFAQGTHKEFIAELYRKGVLKSPIR